MRRWQDHQPLNRLEGIYGREGLPIPKSTICTWHEELAELVQPLVEAMRADALKQPYLCTDATGVLVLAKDRCRTGHFWVTVAPERHVLFQYSRRHDSAAVDALLPGYSGYLVADAHAVYDHLYRDGTVIEVGCWAHARRYFFKALESDPERSKTALAWISALFTLERSMTSTPAKKRREIRQARAAPIADAFFAWCHQEADRVLDESPMAQAIGYARNQQVALRRFLDDGRLPLHNNASELNLRREVVGRKNWLFVGSDDGAGVNATFVSLLASCGLHGLEPLAYMRDLLCLLPRWPPDRVFELAPLHWRQTLEKPEAQQALAANVFRRVVLGLSDAGHDAQDLHERPGRRQRRVTPDGYVSLESAAIARSSRSGLESAAIAGLLTGRLESAAIVGTGGEGHLFLPEPLDWRSPPGPGGDGMVRTTLVVVLALGCGGGGGTKPGPADAEEELPADAAPATVDSPRRLDAAPLAPDSAAPDAAVADVAAAPDALAPDTLTADASPPTNPFVYVGSEMGGEILVFQLDLATGALLTRGRAPSGPSPDYLAFHPSGKYVYALNEVTAGRVVAFSVNRATGMLTRLNDVSSGGAGPAHISVHRSGKWVLAANYASGHVAALPIMDDGRLGEPVAPRLAGANAHMIIDDGVTGKFVFVPSKGDNRVLQFKFDDATGRLEPNTPAFVAQMGAPRHMVFHRSGQFAYLLTEAGRSVISYRYDPATGLLTDGVAQLASPMGDGAHIVLHPSLDLLYVSLRFFDSIGALAITDGRAQPPKHFQQQIARPWDMVIDPTGHYLLVANNDNATVKVLRIDPAGALALAGNGASVNPRPRFVGTLALP